MFVFWSSIAVNYDDIVYCILLQKDYEALLAAADNEVSLKLYQSLQCVFSKLAVDLFLSVSVFIQSLVYTPIFPWLAAKSSSRLKMVTTMVTTRSSGCRVAS